jgi:hypothetical protein
MKRLILLISISFCLLIYLLYISQFEAQVRKDDIQVARSGKFYDYKGAFHIPSRKNRNINDKEILKAANQSHFDFVVFSDTNNFMASGLSDSYFSGTLGIKVRKFSYLDWNILLFEKGSPLVFDSLGEAQIFLTDQLTQKEPNPNFLTVLTQDSGKEFGNTNKISPGVSGIEIINLSSLWQKTWQSSKASVFYSFFSYPFNRRLSILRLINEIPGYLQEWDSIVEKFGKKSGFFSNEATSQVFSIFNSNISFPSMELLFSIGSNHVLLESELTGDLRKDRQKIFSAFQKGSFYFSFDILGNPRGFEAYMRGRDQIHNLGASVTMSESPEIIVKLPMDILVPYEIAILKNGNRVATFNEPSVSYTITEEGSYRVIVRVIPTLPLPDGRQWFTWIYTNHFHVEAGS